MELKRLGTGAAVLLLCLGSTPVYSQLDCDGQRFFLGGASPDLGASYSADVSSAATVTLGGQLCPAAEHIGQSADLYVAFEIAGDIYFLNENDQLRDLASNQLSAYRKSVTLAAEMPQSFYSGVVGAPIESVNLYVGYTLDEVFHYDQQPINFAVSVPAKLSTLSVSPRQDSTTAAATGDIAISFDRPLDPASISNDKLKVFGRWSGVVSGSVLLANNNSTLMFTPGRSRSAGEWVNVSVVDNAVLALDGGTLEGGYNWAFWVESAASSLSFEQISAV